MSTMWEEIRYKVLRSKSRLTLLIVINVAVFLALGIFYAIESIATDQHVLQQTVFTYLELPSNLPVLLKHFWTPFTYLFLHDGLLNTIFNMLWLYWMGQIIEDYLGGKKLTAIYLMGGLVGAVFYIAAFNLIPAFANAQFDSYITGAPACVAAVIVAAATLLPNYGVFIIFFELKLKWLATIYVAFDILALRGPHAAGGFAQLGAALLGFIFIKQLQRGNDWSSLFEKMFQPRPKLKVAVKNSGKFTNPKPRQDEIDRILDKISQTGYESLNKQEKETLFRASSDDKS
ncbi:rhomboid family intramembrane serine protease [Mucilaginibacter sp. AW1-3]